MRTAGHYYFIGISLNRYLFQFAILNQPAQRGASSLILHLNTIAR